ncbi:ABC transporter permease [Candidatus Berkelbacteria bacterium]|nr:ABC transporter permease [Candidatus Berkelbacteria bacterium]
MTWLDTLLMASSNLWRSRVRTALTLVALAVGALTVMLTLALGAGAQAFIGGQLGGLVQVNVLDVYPSWSESSSGSEASTDDPPSTNPFDTTPREYKEPRTRVGITAEEEGDSISGEPFSQPPAITKRQMAAIEQISGVSGVSIQYSPQITYLQIDRGTKYEIQYVDVVFPGYQKAATAAGELPAPTDTDCATLGYQYLSALGLTEPTEALGRELTLGISTQVGGNRTRTLSICGVTATSFLGPSLILGYDLAEQISRLQDRTSQINALVVVLDERQPDPATVEFVQAAIRDQKLEAFYSQESIELVTGMITTAQSVLLGFGAIALIAATIGIVNTLLMAVYERTREIGLMKALGLGRGGIFRLFLTEAAAIGFWGGLGGVLLATGLATIANPLLASWLLPGYGDPELLVVRFGSALAVVVGAAALGSLAGTLPALKASKLHPIEALRYE